VHADVNRGWERKTPLATARPIPIAWPVLATAFRVPLIRQQRPARVDWIGDEVWATQNFTAEATERIVLRCWLRNPID
jgi:hypothetical protein